MCCDMSKAVRLFNSMRHPKCRVLVFDKIERQWKGCSFRPIDTETSELSMLREHRSLERQVAAVRSELRRLVREVEELKKRTKSKRGGKKVADEPEDKPSEPLPETDWDAELREIMETK
jgi:predicted subunit of tRNA(5-methylaminomethyl-2-thiouridylate) methyltransferase